MIQSDTQIRNRLRASLRQAYGQRLQRAVLFGSRPRGDARPDSDYDVAIFLTDFHSFVTEAGRLAKISTDILHDTHAVINALPFPADAWKDRTGLMHEMRREGVEL